MKCGLSREGFCADESKAHNRAAEQDEKTDGSLEGPSDGRRLQISHLWTWPEQAGFQAMPTEWPHRTFFQPETLSCLPEELGEGGLLVGSMYQQYRSELHLGTIHLPKTTVPAGAVALCGSSVSPIHGIKSDVPSCLMGAIAEGGVAIWPFGSDRFGTETVLVPVTGVPWQFLTGAIVSCKSAASLMTNTTDAEWCLILVGWDGASLPVAVVPLIGGLGKPPSTTEHISPRFDAPMLPSTQKRKCMAGVSDDVSVSSKAKKRMSAHAKAVRRAKKDGYLPRGPPTTTTTTQSSCQAAFAPTVEQDKVVAVNLDAASGRLWALHVDGEIEAWELFKLQNSGRWQPTWPEEFGAFEATALCVNGTSSLIVAGISDVSGPALLKSHSLPSVRSVELERI